MALPNQFSTNLGLSVQPEIPQQKYPEIYQEFFRIRNALKILQSALDTYTGALSEDPAYWNQTTASQFARLQNISKVYAQATEDLSLGQYVQIYDVAGVRSARKANATDTTKPCRAYCSVVGGVLAGNYGEFILAGVHPYNAGLTAGVTYYLATTSGLITSVAPATSGNIQQPVGFGLDANNMWFMPTLNWAVVP